MDLASVEAVLRTSRVRASRAESVLAVLRGKPVPTAPGTVEAVACKIIETGQTFDPERRSKGTA